MRLTTAITNALLASNVLAAGLNRRDLQTAQDCLAKIQSAEEAMNTALMVRPPFYKSACQDQTH
ncbi:hypothetical protein IMZ48_04605 [Candidatus Bathyarchaeota archaeon]|nr:hypothetical protein [Candidatus Bathyarchaeota archaeon]